MSRNIDRRPSSGEGSDSSSTTRGVGRTPSSRRRFVRRLVQTGAIAVPIVVAATVTPQAHARP
jgi:hypothetical protein